MVLNPTTPSDFRYHPKQWYIRGQTAYYPKLARSSWLVARKAWIRASWPLSIVLQCQQSDVHVAHLAMRGIPPDWFSCPYCDHRSCKRSYQHVVRAMTCEWSSLRHHNIRMVMPVHPSPPNPKCEPYPSTSTHHSYRQWHGIGHNHSPEDMRIRPQ